MQPPKIDEIEAGKADVNKVAVKALARVFKAWRVNAAAAAALAGVSERTLTRMRSPDWAGSLNQDQLMRASALIGLYKGLHLYFEDDLADKWPKMLNRGPLFRGSAPVEFMQKGGLPAIINAREYVDAIRGGL